MSNKDTAAHFSEHSIHDEQPTAYPETLAKRIK